MEQIEKVRQKYFSYLLSLPNVVGVGFGWLNDGRKVIKVLVTNKLPEFLLDVSECVPVILDGFRTKVVELQS